MRRRRREGVHCLIERERELCFSLHLFSFSALDLRENTPHLSYQVDRGLASRKSPLFPHISLPVVVGGEGRDEAKSWKLDGVTSWWVLHDPVLGEEYNHLRAVSPVKTANLVVSTVKSHMDNSQLNNNSGWSTRWRGNDRIGSRQTSPTAARWLSRSDRRWTNMATRQPSRTEKPRR